MPNFGLIVLLPIALGGLSPVERGELPVKGAKLAYESAGKGNGPAIVLLHAGVSDMSMWDEPFRELSKRNRVIRYDLRKYGASKTEGVQFSHQQDLLALLDHLNVDKAILVGNSLGGIVALDFTLENPSRVSGLISVASSISGFNEEPTSEESAVFAKGEALVAKMDWEAATKLETDIWVNGILQKPDRVPKKIWEQVHRTNANNHIVHRTDATPVPLKTPAIGRLGELRAPVLALNGDLDYSPIQAAMAHLAKKAPNGRLVTYRNTAHMISLERPKEFIREVAAFVKECAKISHH
jgi:pimeloyl-ACP methyl ester carboxylesterase